MGRSSVVLIVALAASGACGSGSTSVPLADPTITSPSQGTPAPPQQAGPITFGGLAGEGTPVTTYTESGFTVAATAGRWEVGANYGNPRPFIRFTAPGGTTAIGELQVTNAGATFSFTSIDLYASTTPIPYAITGLRNAAAVFALTGTLPNTFGQFRTVANPDTATLIDTLKISLTNAAAPCCTNPMGVDNIALAR